MRYAGFQGLLSSSPDHNMLSLSFCDLQLNTICPLSVINISSMTSGLIAAFTGMFLMLSFLKKYWIEFITFVAVSSQNIKIILVLQGWEAISIKSGWAIMALLLSSPEHKIWADLDEASQECRPLSNLFKEFNSYRTLVTAASEEGKMPKISKIFLSKSSLDLNKIWHKCTFSFLLPSLVK